MSPASMPSNSVSSSSPAKQAPTQDALSHLPIAHRNSVQTWECDQMGHFNVQFYVDKASQSFNMLLLLMGYGPEWQRKNRLVPHLYESHMRFLAEQMPGAPYYTKAGIVERIKETLHIYVEMRATLDDRPCASFNLIFGFENPTTEEVVDLPEAIDKAAAPYRCTVPEYGKARGLDTQPARPRPNLSEAEEFGMIETYLSQVQPHQCDPYGRFTPRGFMSVVSDSIPNLLTLSGGSRNIRKPPRDKTIGGAALEYRFVYHSLPKAYDILRLRSGISALQAKTYTWVHWLFDAQSGYAVATAAAVAITLDLTARKSMNIPDDVRARLERHMQPHLSV